MTKLILKKDIEDADGNVLVIQGSQVELVSTEGDHVMADNRNRWDHEREVITFPLQKDEFDLHVDDYEIQIKNVYNSDDIKDEVMTVGYSRLGRSLADQPEKVSKLLGEMLNNFYSHGRTGYETGQALRREHRTLQRSVVMWAFFLIKGISEQEHTDPRNEMAIEAAQKLAKMLNDDEFNFGPLV